MNKLRFLGVLALFAALSGCAGSLSEAQINGLNQGLLSQAQAAQWTQVERSIKEGANVNAQDGQGRTALYFAADKGDMDAVKFLIDQGANVNLADINGQTPLDRAALRSFLDIVRYLVQNGASANN